MDTQKTIGMMSGNLMLIGGLKKQHKHATSTPAGAGSVNMGLVSQAAPVGGIACHLNTNANKTKVIMDDVTQLVFPTMLKLFDCLFPGWDISFGNLHRNVAPEVPHMHHLSRPFFYNGFQCHHNHCCSLQNDTNDICGVPTATTCLGHVSSVLRIHVNGHDNNPIDVTTSPGGMSLMDSHPSHEVVVEENKMTALPAKDGHGVFVEGRNSLVTMANQQCGNCVSQKHASAALSASSKKED